MFLSINKILIIVALAFPVFSLEAQEIPSRENDGVNNTSTRNARKTVYFDLNLSKEQQKKLQVVNKESREKIKELGADNSLTAQERRAKMLAVRQEMEAKRKNIFTEEQYAAYRKNVKESRKKGAVKGDNNVASRTEKNKGKDINGLSIRNNEKVRKGGNVGWRNLQLTAEQREKMKATGADYNSKVQAIKNNASLTGVEKQGRIKEVYRTYDMQVKSILTAEQQTKWDNRRKARMLTSSKALQNSNSQNGFSNN